MIWICCYLGRRQHSDAEESPGDDDNLRDFLRHATTVGAMESRCEEFLNGRVFRNQIHLDSGEHLDELSIFAPVGSSDIQAIIDEHQDLDNIRLRRPTPNLLPIVISRIDDDRNSFIIPSEDLTISAILSRSPTYQLEAVMCEINDRCVIFIKDLSTDEWYYYQERYSCEKLNEELNRKLNQIIRARTIGEQRRLIRTAHFLVSVIFYNAVRYIYKRGDD